jgi:hypothetical protein
LRTKDCFGWADRITATATQLNGRPRRICDALQTDQLLNERHDAIGQPPLLVVAERGRDRQGPEDGGRQGPEDVGRHDHASDDASDDGLILPLAGADLHR